MALQVTPDAFPSTAGNFYPFFERLAGPKGSGGTPVKGGGGKKSGGSKTGGGGKKGGSKKGGSKKR
jgi:hypothetical protein